MGVLTGCKPRKEVLKGDLDDTVFAADFGDLVAGKGAKVYRDANLFFQNTHPAKPLCKVVRAIFGRLASPKEGGATIRLSTGFGGGKTHTLMALWHLARNIDDPSMGIELLPAAGRPKSVAVAAVDAGKAGTEEFAAQGKTRTHSLWGQLFFLLGGEKALKELGKADHPEASPSDRQIEGIFPGGPVLILLDELVVYMAKLSERGQGNMLGFVNSLAAVVAKRPQTVLVVTDPGGQAAYVSQASKLGSALESAAKKLDEILGRKMTDFDPIGDESARVIVRRLFESVDPAAAQAASAAYHSLYERVVQTSPGTVPPEAGTAEYAGKVVECYPFHPRLMATAQDRLGALQDFQKSRGVLRLFARIVRDTWEAKADCELISAGEIDWSSARIQSDLLHRLNRDSFKAAVSADIQGHAAGLDGDAPRGVHRRVASALLLESLPMQQNSGLDPSEAALAVLGPDEAGQEPAEALDRLVGVCWHTYPMPGGRGWQFQYEPNIIKQIEERKSKVPLEDARSRVLAEAQDYFRGARKPVAWPNSARQVPESAELQIVLCEDEKTARAVCAYADDSDPAAPVPRAFQNAILAVTAPASELDQAIESAQRLIAAERIEREHKSGEAGKLVREQIQKVRPLKEREFRLRTYRAFSRIVTAGGMAYSLEEKYQVPEEQMLQRPRGQDCVLTFLNDKGLIYQSGDALDIDRFVKDILPGAVPAKDRPDSYTARALHERVLSAPGLRLLPDGNVVRRTILKALEAGKLVVRTPDGRAFDGKGCVEGLAGARRRTSASLPSLSLHEDVLVTVPGSGSAAEWLKEDAAPRPGEQGSGGAPTPPPPPPPSSVTADSWDRLVTLAAERPLVKMEITSRDPASAKELVALVQPLGAEAVSLTVSTGGPLKDGGTMNYAASDVKPSHPARPLEVARGVFSSLAEESEYEAKFALDFGQAGRAEMREALERLREEAPDGVKVSAKFGKPGGTA